MKKCAILLLVLLFSTALSAHKPVDTLSARRWEFVQNLGQWDASVRFSAKTNGGALFFENNALTVTQLHPQQLQEFHEAKHTGKPFPQTYIDAAAYRVTFVGAHAAPAVEGAFPFEHYYNYFIGNDPRNWASRVPVFQNIVYRQLYDNIDLLFLDDNDYLKYEFHIAPGGNPDQIQLRYDGLKSASKVGETLLLHTAVDRVVELAPFAYQIDYKGDTITIDCSYRLQGNLLTFALGTYDPTLPLVIDPTVVFSSFSGSAADNWGYTATYDSHGNLYGGGIAFGIGYPVTLGAYQMAFSGQVDVAISKFDATGSFLHYSTYLGGNVADIPHSLHINDNDELYIFGTTGSANFPVTANAFDTTFNGGPNTTLSTSMTFQNGSDIFIAKLSADGTQLPAATFIGGSGNDGINIAPLLRKNYADDNRGEIIVDENSNVYVVTSTHSLDFPVTTTYYQPDSSSKQEVCVFKMSQDLSTLIWSCYYGGSGDDAGYSMFVAADKSVYICGGTTSTNLPVTSSAIQTSHADASEQADGFVAHLSANGNLWMHSTYLGKSGYDQAYLIKGDNEDFPHILGQTSADGLQWVQNASYYVPGGGQFLPAAVAPEGPQAAYAHGLRPQDVVLPVSHHEALLRRYACGLQSIADDVRLFRPRFVHGRAADGLEVSVQVEVGDDLPGKLLRLGGGDSQAEAVCPQPFQRLRDAGIDGILEHTPRRKVFPVEAHRLTALFLVEAAEVPEAPQEGRADEGPQLRRFRRLYPQLAQGIGHGGDDAGARIRQGPVQVEEDAAWFH